VPPSFYGIIPIRTSELMKEKRDRPSAFVVFLLALFVFAPTASPEMAKMQTSNPELPARLGSWTRGETTRTVTAENIFEYMDGAGELYIGYRFDRLEVTEYTAPDEKNILVEIYYMKTPDDAFGLLSLDWGGETLEREKSSPEYGESPPDWPNALYGEGLLRLRSDKIYARIMAERETPRSREAVLALGRAIVRDGAGSSIPALLSRLPATLWPEWKQRRPATSYFRSHLVLNSLYYLSQENLFDLGPETEAAITQYERESPLGTQRFRVLLIHYPEPQAAGKALAHFRRVYLPDHPTSSSQTQGFFSVEDGWLGFKRSGRLTTFVFECPDRETATAVLGQL
jgi:hypothetical protein